MKHDGQVVNINNFLVQEEMAKMYEGGKKQPFIQEDYDNFKAKHVDTEWPTFVDYPYPVEN